MRQCFDLVAILTLDVRGLEFVLDTHEFEFVQAGPVENAESCCPGCDYVQIVAVGECFVATVEVYFGVVEVNDTCNFSIFL